MPPSPADSSSPFEDDPLDILRAAQSEPVGIPTDAPEDERSIAGAPASEPEASASPGASEESEAGAAEEPALDPEFKQDGEPGPSGAGAPDDLEPQAEATTLEVSLDAVPRIQFVMGANGCGAPRFPRVNSPPIATLIQADSPGSPWRTPVFRSIE